jgi:hypothetical protein
MSVPQMQDVLFVWPPQGRVERHVLSQGGRTHTPFTQSLPARQALLQVPQWLGFVDRSVQIPLQGVAVVLLPGQRVGLDVGGMVEVVFVNGGLDVVGMVEVVFAIGRKVVV